MPTIPEVATVSDKDKDKRLAKVEKRTKDLESRIDKFEKSMKKLKRSHKDAEEDINAAVVSQMELEETEDEGADTTVVASDSPESESETTQAQD
jgi:septal ring factor EnvC (AmiA/AmiB activator)